METTNTISTTFGGSFGNGWKTMSKYFLILFLVVFVLGILSIPTNFISMGFDGNDFKWAHHLDLEYFDSAMLTLGVFAVFIGILALAYSVLVYPIFNYGSSMMFVDAARDKRPDFDTLISGFRKNYLHIVLANILVFALVGMGFIFLIIPGFIVLCRLAFVPYLVMDKSLDPIAAVEESWRMTKGHGWKIFFMGFISIFIFLGGLILCFVGVFPAIVWVRSSFASLYAGIDAQQAPVEEIVGE